RRISLRPGLDHARVAGNCLYDTRRASAEWAGAGRSLHVSSRKRCWRIDRMGTTAPESLGKTRGNSGRGNRFCNVGSGCVGGSSGFSLVAANQWTRNDSEGNGGLVLVAGASGRGILE